MGYGSMASSGTTGHRVRGKKMGWGVAVIVGNITVRKQISGGGSRGHMSNGCAGWRRPHRSVPGTENGKLTSAGSGRVSGSSPEVTEPSSSLPVRSSGGVLCSAPLPPRPQSSRKCWQHAKPRTLPLRACVLSTEYLSRSIIETPVHHMPPARSSPQVQGKSRGSSLELLGRVDVKLKVDLWVFRRVSCLQAAPVVGILLPCVHPIPEFKVTEPLTKRSRILFKALDRPIE